MIFRYPSTISNPLFLMVAPFNHCCPPSPTTLATGGLIKISLVTRVKKSKDPIILSSKNPKSNPILNSSVDSHLNELFSV